MVSLQQSYYVKSVTNYAVTLEKLGKRQEAIDTLNNLKTIFRDEVRVFNNLGIIQKRAGGFEESMESYLQALKIQPECFFP